MSSFFMTYDGTTSDDLGIYVVRRPSIPSPEPVYEPYTIPGRDGILMPTEITYAPLEIDVECNFMADTPEAWAAQYRKAKKWITGSGNLIFSDDPEYLYKVYSANITDVDRSSKRIGYFVGHFVCEPYQYTVSGQEEIRTMGMAGAINRSGVIWHPRITAIVTAPARLYIQEHGDTGLYIPRSCIVDTEHLVVTDYANGDIITQETTGDITNLYITAGWNSMYLTQCDGDGLRVISNERVL